MLEIDAFASRVRCEEQPRLTVIELVFDSSAVFLIDVTMDDENLVGPWFVFHEIEEIIERISVFGEEQDLLVRLFFEKLLNVSTDLLCFRINRDSFCE
jgi:hypothetical protein